MARVVLIGAGVVGLGTAMLLAQDGHEVVVLERDESAPVATGLDAWDEWQRRGVNQFRLPHFLLARTRRVLDSELPEVGRAIEDAGGLRANPILAIPEAVRGPDRQDDHDFEILTARRPVFELAFAQVADSTKGVEIRRGTTVEALLCDGDGPAGVPRVVGVRTTTGDVRGDLVLDVGGRRSAMPRLLAEAGAQAPVEELDDSGFMYFARHYTSSDGSLPFALGPALMNLGTITSITLPADNGTWGLVLVTNSKDRALLGLREPGRWEAAFRSLPLVAHWLDGSPIDDGVTTMSKIEDRIRTYVVDGAPVAAGVVAVGDAWACSNPSQGRGVSIGFLHGLALRETIRSVGLDDLETFSLAFDEATRTRVQPWFTWTRFGDRHRLAEVDTLIGGGRYEPEDPEWELEQALVLASSKDPDLLRIQARALFVLEPLSETLASPSVRAKVLELGGGWRDEPLPAPSRDELVAIANA